MGIRAKNLRETWDKKMKIKDLKGSITLNMISVKYKGKIYKVVSGWGSGKEPPYQINLWLRGEGSRVIPVTAPEAGELEVVEK